MMILALALAAFPPLDPVHARAHCETKVEEASEKGRSDTLDSCLAEQAVEHRRFRLLARQESADFEKPFALCISDWTEGAVTDWNMAAYCASRQIIGRRAFRLLRAATPAAMHPSLDNCIADGSREGVPDWSEVTNCAEYQLQGKEDLDRLKQDAGGKHDAIFKACETYWIEESDGSADWRMTASCAEDKIAPAAR